MASTAQYWQPVWGALERSWKPVCHRREGAGGTSGGLPLAQAQSNRGRKGGKKDFPDAERLVKRLAQELILSFVPEAEQRLWRAVTRRKYQLTRNRVQLPNRLESLLEEAHSKLSSLVSDLLGVSARRMLNALAEGETNPLALAAFGGPASARQRGAVDGCLGRVHRTPPGVPPLIADGAAGAAIPRAAKGPTGAGDSGPAAAARNRVSSAGAAPRTPSHHRSHCSSPWPPYLADSPSRSALRRTRPSGEPKVATPAYSEDDPGAAKTGLPG